MPAQGPGEAPPVVVRRARRVRRQQQRASRPAPVRPVGQAHERPTPPTPSARPPTRQPRPVQRVQRVQRPPAGDVASSGGDYGTHVARDFKRHQQYRGAAVAAYTSRPVHERRALAHRAAARLDAGKGTEADRAIVHAHVTRVAGKRKVERAVAAYNALSGTTAHDVAFPPAPSRGLHLAPGYSKPGKPTQKGSLLTAVKGLGGAIRAVGEASSRGYASVRAPKIVQNAPKDFADLVVTTPSSLAKLGSEVVHHPQRVPGELVAPYKQLVEHPGRFIEAHPVSAALMVAPVVRAPGRVAGRVARVTGRQTLERPAARFEGTNLRQPRTGSRGAVTRAVQARRDTRRGAPQMTVKHVNRRVDEFFDAHRPQERALIDQGRAEIRARGLTGEEADAHLKVVRKRARKQVNRAFTREFGGEVHPTREAAQAAAAELPFEATVRKLPGGEFTNVPKLAVRRLEQHRGVGTSKAVGSKVMRTATRTFSQAVLPTSPRWLMGQAGETGFRATVAGAGPTSLLREAKVYRRLERESPGAGEQFRARTSGGGMFAPSSTARELLGGRMTLADVFKDTPLEKPARGATRVGALPGFRHIRDGYNEYSRIVMQTVNGAIEQTGRRAMAGKAIKESPLMEQSILGLGDRAIADAAKGLHATENQVAVGRAVDRMFGQYQKFSPAKRETLLHSTPFFPWFQNMATFLLRVLPVDHPVHAALVADLDAATEEWRKAHHLSLRDPNHVPGFLLGRAPAGEGFVPVGRYLPFAPDDIAGSAADLVFPQFSAPLLNLRGVEWTGKPLKGKPIPSAALTAAETYVPGLAQADRISGVSRAVRKKGRVGIAQGAKTGQALRQEFDPFVATQPPKVTRKGKRRVVRVVPLNPLLKPVKVKRVKVLPLGGG